MRQSSTRIHVGADRAAEQRFESLGEQLVAIIRASSPGGQVDPRLARVNGQGEVTAGPSGMHTSVSSEGGFFIEPALLPGVIDPAYAEDPFLSRVLRIPVGEGRRSVKYNVVDEESRKNGSRWGAVQGYWLGEGETGAPTKSKLRQMQLVLKKLLGLAYLTDELMQDSPAATALLTRAFQTELRFMLSAAVRAANGGAQPIGVLRSGALITQDIEATQTIANTDQFIARNTAKMLARIPADLWGEVIWLYNPDLFEALTTATVGTSSVPVFMSIGGPEGKPRDTIWGRAAFASELCEAVGTPGDLLAVVPSQYHVADRTAKQATSLHVRFLFEELAFKITYPVDGQPVWSKPVTPYVGSTPRSPFVALAARA